MLLAGLHLLWLQITPADDASSLIITDHGEDNEGKTDFSHPGAGGHLLGRRASFRYIFKLDENLSIPVAERKQKSEQGRQKIWFCVLTAGRHTEVSDSAWRRK